MADDIGDISIVLRYPDKIEESANRLRSIPKNGNMLIYSVLKKQDNEY